MRSVTAPSRSVRQQRDAARGGRRRAPTGAGKPKRLSAPTETTARRGAHGVEQAPRCSTSGCRGAAPSARCCAARAVGRHQRRLAGGLEVAGKSSAVGAVAQRSVSERSLSLPPPSAGGCSTSHLDAVDRPARCRAPACVGRRRPSRSARVERGEAHPARRQRRSTTARPGRRCGRGRSARRSGRSRRGCSTSASTRAILRRQRNGRDDPLADVEVDADSPPPSITITAAARQLDHGAVALADGEEGDPQRRRATARCQVQYAASAGEQRQAAAATRRAPRRGRARSSSAAERAVQAAELEQRRRHHAQAGARHRRAQRHQRVGGADDQADQPRTAAAPAAARPPPRRWRPGRRPTRDDAEQRHDDRIGEQRDQRHLVEVPGRQRRRAEHRRRR